MVFTCWALLLAAINIEVLERLAVSVRLCRLSGYESVVALFFLYEEAIRQNFLGAF
jgi:hypothetical protein